MPDEPLQALLKVVEALEALGIRYAVGGSIASSIHGEPRMTADADLLAELTPQHASAFIARLGDGFYVEEASVHDAISRLEARRRVAAFGGRFTVTRARRRDHPAA